MKKTDMSEKSIKMASTGRTENTYSANADMYMYVSVNKVKQCWGLMQHCSICYTARTKNSALTERNMLGLVLFV